MQNKVTFDVADNLNSTSPLGMGIERFSVSKVEVSPASTRKSLDTFEANKLFKLVLPVLDTEDFYENGVIGFFSYYNSNGKYMTVAMAGGACLNSPLPNAK